MLKKTRAKDKAWQHYLCGQNITDDIRPTFIIDSERLAPVGQDLVLADVPVTRGAVLVGCLDAQDLVIDAALVHRLHVGSLAEYRRELVHVRHRNMDGDPGGDGGDG